MVRKLLVAVVAAAFLISVAPVSAQWGGANSNLHQQYSTYGANSVNAGMYPAPHRTPAHVGATYNTYQPLQPHEMMYQHSRNYYNYYAGPEAFYGRGSGLNKTSVVWQSGTNHMGPLPFNSFPLSDLSYKWNAYRYCLKSGGGAGCSCHLNGSCGGGFGGHLRGKFQNRHHHFGSRGCASGGCDSGGVAMDYGYDSGVSYGGGYDAGYSMPAAPVGGGCATGGCSLGANQIVAPVVTQEAKADFSGQSSILENKGTDSVNLSDRTLNR